MLLVPARAEQTKIDFDQGMDSSRILEAIRRESPIVLIDKATIVPVQLALKDSDYPIIGPITGINLIDRVQNSAPYDTALQYPPLIEVLEPADRNPLKAEWSDINKLRTNLLSDANDQETEDWKLYERAVALDKNAERLNLRQERLGTEIGNFNRQCAGRPLPPDEYNACVRRQTDLNRRLRAHNAEVVQHNKNEDQWRSEAADLRNRAGMTALNGKQNNRKALSFLGRVAAWEQQKIAPFTNRAAAAVRRGRVTRVTIEAQGANPPVQKPVSLVTKKAVCKRVGEGMLGNLLSQLTDSERADRDEAFTKAYAWIASRPAAGVSAPPPVRVPFQNANRLDPTARVDVNIWAGTAFATCPCCSK